MNIVTKLFNIANAVARRSYWINNVVFADCNKFWYLNEFNIELVNLGSSSAKSAFNYRQNKILAKNWAMSPQSFVGDYAVLTNYCSYLKKNAIIVIPICPFSIFGGGNEDLDDKYYTVVRPISIPNASLRRRDAICDIRMRPLKYMPISSLVYIFRKVKKSKPQITFEQNAKLMIESWQKEFSIHNLNNEFSLINKDRYADSVDALKRLISFCISRGFRPILTIPPVHNSLNSYFPENIRDRYITQFLNDANTANIPVLNYMSSEMSKDDTMFADSFLLNEKGSLHFTEEFLNDLKAIYTL